MNAFRFLPGSSALIPLLTLAACGGSGDGQQPKALPATTSTLAYVVTECRADSEGRGTIRQSLHVLQRDRAPVAVVEHSAADFHFARSLCRSIGVDRSGYDFGRVGVFHRLGVTPNGSQ